MRRLLIGFEQPVDHVLEPAGGRRRTHLDALQPLHAACADVARHDHPQGRAMIGVQRLAVHLPGEQHLLGQRLVQRNRARELLRRFGLVGHVRAREGDVAGIGGRLDECEHVRECRTGPPRRPDRPWAPRLLTGDVGHVGQPGAPVARALQRRADLMPRQRPQLVEREHARVADQAVDPHAPVVRVDARGGPVVAHVEALRRRERGRGQFRARGLGVQRVAAVDDHAAGSTLRRETALAATRSGARAAWRPRPPSSFLGGSPCGGAAPRRRARSRRAVPAAVPPRATSPCGGSR